MAKPDEPKPGSKRNLKPDQIVQRLKPDPSKIPNARVLAGFLGKSTREGYWRLYVSLQMNEYIEIAENDIVDTQPMGEEETVGGSLVWVRHDAVVEFTVSGPLRAQGEFLQGGITGEYLPGMGVEAFAQVNPALIGTIIKTVTRLLCTRKTLCTGWCCPDTGQTGCAPGSCLICARL
jgi:hypothetical protein